MNELPRLSAAAIRRPGRTLLIAAALTLVTATGIGRLELRTDGRALAPPRAPEVILDQEIRRDFGVRDPLAVVLTTEHPAGIYQASILRRVSELSSVLGGIEGSPVEGVRPFDVTSLATETGLRFKPGSLVFSTLLDPLPETPAALDQLREDLERIALYEGTLVSHDGQSAAIFVAVPPHTDRAVLTGEIERLAVDILRPGPDESIAVLGAPVAEALLGRHILEDLGLPVAATSGGERGLRVGMVPLALMVMLIVFGVAFRRPAAALLPLLEVGVCLSIVFGTMGWLGHPVYLTTAVLPVILVAVGTADEIHVFRRYLELAPAAARSDEMHREVVRAAMRDMAPPVIQTSFTTGAAFLSFALSPLPPVRTFGLYTAFGVILCMLFSLTVLPALFVLLGPEPWVRRAASGLFKTSAASARWVRFAHRHRRTLLAAGALSALLAIDGVRRLEVQDSWIDGFAQNSAFARATRHFDEQFLGSHLLRLVIEAEAPRLAGEIPANALDVHELRLATIVEPQRLDGSSIRLFQLRSASDTPPLAGPPREWTTWIESARHDSNSGGMVLVMPRQRGSARFWLRPADGEKLGYEIRGEPFTVPAILERVAELESFVAAEPGVGGVLGPARYLSTVRFMVRSTNAPPAEGEASRRLPAAPDEARRLWSNYGRVRGAGRLHQLIDEDYRRALVTVYLEDSNYRDTERLMRRIREFETERLAPRGIRLDFAGDVAVSQALISGVVSTQVRSVLLSLLAIFLITAWFTRSWRDGLRCLIPPAFAVLLCFAVMGWARIPLGVATSMFAGMTLGVGVDFAIHLMARHRRARERGLAGEAAAESALVSTGPAILIDACAVALGFGVLIVSQVPANARLGGLLMVSVLGCLVASLVFLPALWGGRKRGRPAA